MENTRENRNDPRNSLSELVAATNSLHEQLQRAIDTLQDNSEGIEF